MSETNIMGATGLYGMSGLAGLPGNRGLNGYTGLNGNTGLTGNPGNSINDCAYIFNSTARTPDDYVFKANQNISLDSQLAGDISPINTNDDLFNINADNIQIKQSGVFKFCAELSVVENKFENIGLKVVTNIFNPITSVRNSDIVICDFTQVINLINNQPVTVSIQPTIDVIIGNIINDRRPRDTNYIVASLRIIKIA